MNKEIFIEELNKLGIILSDEQLYKLSDFYNILLEWNEKINLTTITEEVDVYLKHFYDSLTLIRAIDLTKNLSLCDVGTGAGFPGIVLKIVFPNLKVTLIDSLNKRITYLKEVIRRLNLLDIEAIHVRMEDYSRLNMEKFDVITARAVASISTLAEVSAVSLKISGTLILMKGNCKEEVDNSKAALKKLSLEIVDVIEFKLPFEDSIRTLVIITKKSRTDKTYPRNIDKIKKSPL